MDKNIPLSSTLESQVDVIKPKEMGVPLGNLGAIVTLQIRDQKTGDLEFEKKFVSQSFVKQFLQLLRVMFMGQSNYYMPADGWELKDTDGDTHYDIVKSAAVFRAAAPLNNDTYGIQVGTNNAAPTISDYVLGTQIAHGIGAGQLQYSAVAFGAPSEDGVTSQFVVTRDFANNSGATITVEEIGLAIYYASNENFLILHDVTGSINVLNGKTLTVNYQIEANV